MIKEDTNGFKDPSGLTKWTKGFLYAQIVIAVIALISGMLEYQLLNDFQNGVYTSEIQIIAAAESNATRQGIVGIIGLIIFVISAILILKWIYRANYNAHQLGATDMKFTPGWSVGWYFIPFANLWKPYQAMKEIWMVSKNPANWKSQSVSTLLPWWWFFWIVSSILASASLKSSMRAEELNELILTNVVTLVSDVVEIPLSLIVLVMFGKIYEMQIYRHRKDL